MGNFDRKDALGIEQGCDSIDSTSLDRARGRHVVRNNEFGRMAACRQLTREQAEKSFSEVRIPLFSRQSRRRCTGSITWDGNRSPKSGG